MYDPDFIPQLKHCCFIPGPEKLAPVHGLGETTTDGTVKSTVVAESLSAAVPPAMVGHDGPNTEL